MFPQIGIGDQIPQDQRPPTSGNRVVGERDLGFLSNGSEARERARCDQAGGEDSVHERVEDGQPNEPRPRVQGAATAAAATALPENGVLPTPEPKGHDHLSVVCLC